MLQEKGEIGDALRKTIDLQNKKDILVNWLKLASKVNKVEEFEEKIKGCNT